MSSGSFRSSISVQVPTSTIATLNSESRLVAVNLLSNVPFLCPLCDYIISIRGISEHAERHQDVYLNTNPILKEIMEKRKEEILLNVTNTLTELQEVLVKKHEENSEESEESDESMADMTDNVDGRDLQTQEERENELRDQELRDEQERRQQEKELEAQQEHQRREEELRLVQEFNGCSEYEAVRLATAESAQEFEYLGSLTEETTLEIVMGLQPEVTEDSNKQLNDALTRAWMGNQIGQRDVAPVAVLIKGSDTQKQCSAWTNDQKPHIIDDMCAKLELRTEIADTPVDSDVLTHRPNSVDDNTTVLDWIDTYKKAGVWGSITNSAIAKRDDGGNFTAVMTEFKNPLPRLSYKFTYGPEGTTYVVPGQNNVTVTPTVKDTHCSS